MTFRRLLPWIIGVIGLTVVAIAVFGLRWGAELSEPPASTASEKVTKRFAELFAAEEKKLGFDCRKIGNVAMELAAKELRELSDRAGTMPLGQAITPEIQQKVAMVNDLMIKCAALYNMALQGNVDGKDAMRAPDNMRDAVSKVYAVVTPGPHSGCDAECTRGLRKIIEDARQAILRSEQPTTQDGK